MTTRNVKTRRTQGERREETIRKLIDAATECLIDVGYASASVQKICARAGVSQGGLFRHYPTREALMVAVGDDVSKRLLAGFRARFEAHHADLAPPIVMMRLVRDLCRSRLNLAWYELAMASRTSPALHAALQPAAVRYREDVGELARRLQPRLAETLGENFVVAGTLVATFDGEVMRRFILRDEADEDARLELMATMFEMLARMQGA